MLAFAKDKPKTFNPLKMPTKRNGVEMCVSNKCSGGISRKVLVELKKEKTLTNAREYAVGLGGSTKDKVAFKHPTIFPEHLAADYIVSWKKPNNIVFDPMCGSGTNLQDDGAGVAAVVRHLYFQKVYCDCRRAHGALPIKIDDWVCCVGGEGHQHEDGKPSRRLRHFPGNSVGRLDGIQNEKVTVWHIERDETWDVPIASQFCEDSRMEVII